MFDDSVFNGGCVLLRVRFDRNLVRSYALSIENLSRSRFMYELSRRRIADSEANSFVEPVRPYSNVEGGLGIFAASNIQELPEIKLDGVTRESLVGRYEAVVLRIHRNDVRIDLLLAGASLQLDLMPDGTATAQLHVPGSTDAGLPLGDTVLSGTFSFEDGLVRFDLQPRTILNDLDFDVQPTSGTLVVTSEDGVDAHILLVQR